MQVIFEKNRVLKNVVFALWIVMLLILSVATWIEREDADFVSKFIYGSPLFVALWCVWAVAGLLWLLRCKIYRFKTTFFLHISLVMILIGALCSYLWSDSGYVHLRQGVPATCYVSQKSEQMVSLPFLLTLHRFDIETYPGTDAPSDYISEVSIRCNKQTLEAMISMNRILTIDGYRFYQSSYDEDGQGSVLMVGYDPIGVTVTYVGYLLLVLSMIAVLLDKNGTFRKLWQSSLLKSSALTVLLLLSSVAARAETCPMSSEVAEEVGRVRVLYQDRVTMLQTMAIDVTKKLTGKSSYADYSAEQVLCGLIFAPEQWQREPMIHVKNEQIRQWLQMPEWVAWLDFYTPTGEYRLSPYIDSLIKVGQHDKLLRAFAEIDEKVQLIAMLHAGTILRVVPVKREYDQIWLPLTDSLPEQWSMIAQGDMQALADFRAAQDSTLGDACPSIAKTTCEHFLNRFSFIDILYRFNLGLGFGAVAYFVWGLLTSKRKRWMLILFYVQLIHAFVFLTLALGLRWYVSGHLPLSNGYETMLFVAWCILLITFIMGKRSAIMPAAGLLLSGFALLVASLGSMNPQITPLMPVLQSSWLSLHVSMIMISYSLLAFMTMNGLISLVIILIASKKNYLKIKQNVERLSEFSRFMLYPATFLLMAGIFAGAVWANVSWGTYWSWDPKETWALITMLVYSLAFHQKSIRLFDHPFYIQVFFVYAFLTVLMTYFGVNTFMGGMHSYAGEDARQPAMLWYSGWILLIISGLICLSVRKYRKMENSVI